MMEWLSELASMVEVMGAVIVVLVIVSLCERRLP